MLPELEPYIARYYDKWLNYSQYLYPLEYQA